MKLRLITLLSLLIACIFLLVDGFFNEAQTHVAGAPIARCGSIADPLTCSNCHSGGPNTLMAGWITSDIPPYGYVPGTTYTITATATYVGRSKFGFEISPQDPISSSSSRGTCSVTDLTNTQLITGVSGKKYMTHKTAGTTGTADSHTWSFHWTAPATGADSVIFYGAFLCTNSSNSSSGDITYKSTLTVHRDPTIGIDEAQDGSSAVSVFPNPVIDHINLNYDVKQESQVEIKLFDLEGKMVMPLYSGKRQPGNYSGDYKFPFNLDNGIYLLEISSESARITKKILVQQ